MAVTAEPCVVTCDSCMRMCREKSDPNLPGLSYSPDVGYLTSSCSDNSIQQCLAVEPKVTMKSIHKALAAAMSIKCQTLPNIQECICPSQLPISSPLFGCTLEEVVCSFNSISSNDGRRLDATWQNFLRSIDASVFSEGKEEEPETSAQDDLKLLEPSSSEITPEDNVLDEIMYQTLSDVMATQDEITVEEQRSSKETVTPMKWRKDAGQRKEKKANRVPHSRKTAQAGERNEDRDSPFGWSAAPFRMNVLPSINDVPGDEVACRNRGALTSEDRRCVEAQYMEYTHDSSSSPLTNRRKLRWLSPQAVPNKAVYVPRKQASIASLEEVVPKAKRDSIHKVAGVHDGSRKRKQTCEKWIRV